MGRREYPIVTDLVGMVERERAATEGDEMLVVRSVLDDVMLVF